MKKRRRSQTAAPTRAFPYRERDPRSMLAPRTVEGRPAALDNPRDSSAAWARLPFAIVNREGLGEITKLAVGRREIAQGRAAGCDRFAEDALDSINQPAEPLERNGSSRPLRVNAGAVQSFADIDVAKAGNDPLIEQQELDRRISSGEPTLQLFR